MENDISQELLEKYLSEINSWYDSSDFDFEYQTENSNDVKIVHDLLINDILPENPEEDSNLSHILGNYYEKKKDYDNMKYYYLKAINKMNSNAMVDLGIHYQDQKDYIAMRKYYLMAIKEKNSYGMYLLGHYYEELGDFITMEKYYLKAFRHKNVDATIKLQVHYDKIKNANKKRTYLLLSLGFVIVSSFLVHYILIC